MVISVRLLSMEQARRRAARLRLVIAGCDGVGMGVARLRAAGIETVIVTAERSPRVLRRADKLQIAAFLGVSDKRAHLDELLEELDVARDEVAFIGDHVDDLSVMERVADLGLVAAPNDAMPEVIARAHYVASAKAGHGAFRELAEWILLLRGAAGQQSERPWFRRVQGAIT